MLDFSIYEEHVGVPPVGKWGANSMLSAASFDLREDLCFTTVERELEDLKLISRVIDGLSLDSCGGRKGK